MVLRSTLAFLQESNLVLRALIKNVKIKDFTTTVKDLFPCW